VKRTILILGIIISISLNIDTIHITTSLWQNKEMAKTLSALAVSSMERIEKSDSGFEMRNANGELLYSIKNSQKENLTNVVTEIGTFPIPLGWGPDSFAFLKQPKWGWEILSKIVGWAITAVAIFLGAPFWFDLLSKVVNLRGSGTKPASAKK
jgi:hypothetical protein